MTALRMVVLSLTGQCNFACQYCYASDHPQEQMSLVTAIKALAIAGKSGQPFVLQFTGGEPLMAFALMKDIIQYVKDHKLPAIMQVQSNASLFDQERARYLHQHKVGIGISLDGRPKINDELRCLPSGEGACQSILYGVKQLGLAKVETGITCVVSDINVRQLTGIVEMAYYLGNVRRIGFDLLRSQGLGSKLVPPGAADVGQGVYEALCLAEKFAKETGKKILFSQMEQVMKLAQGKRQGFAHCHAITGEAIFVDAQGNLYPCPSLVGNTEFLLGHVDTGLDEGRQQRVTRSCQESMRFCRECSDFPLCGGGCFARWHGSGCAEGAYEVECSFKRVFIKWHHDNK